MKSKTFFILLLLSFPTFAAVEFDNIGVDTNSIISVNTDGNILLNPTGTGQIGFPDLTVSTVPYLNASGYLTSSAVTPTELGYLSGVTSAIQTQINSVSSGGSAALAAHEADTTAIHGITDTTLLATLAGTQTLTNKSIDADSNTITNIENADIKAAAAISLNKLATTTVSRALVSDGSGFISPATTTSTQIGYLSTTTSDVQTQIDGKFSKSTLTTKGDLAVATGASTIVREPVGADNTVLIADSAQTSGIKWGSVAGLSNLSVTSKVAAYTATTGDDVVLADSSAGAYTVGLYTAVGNSGKTIRIKKTDTSVNLVTVDPNSTETIDGSTTLKLSTQYESITLVSNGTNWNLIDRDYPKAWVAYTPTFTGFGVVTNINVRSRREGANLLIYGSFTSGTSTAVEARMTLGYNGTSANVTSQSWFSSTQPVGYGVFSVATAVAPVVMNEASTTYLVFGFQNATTSGLSKQNGSNFTASGTSFRFFASVPINGWSE